MNLDFARQIVEKYSKVNFNENPISGSRDVSCGPTNEQTDKTNLIVPFHNFAKAPETRLPESKIKYTLELTYL